MKINKLTKENLENSIIYNCLNDYKISSSIDNFTFKQNEKYTQNYLEENIKSFNFLIKCTKLKEILEVVNTKYILNILQNKDADVNANIDNLQNASILYVVNKDFKFENKKIKKGNYTAKELEDIFDIQVQEYINKGFITETKRNAS